MRIALVIERFLPGAGGVEGVAWRVAHGLASAGEEVHVVARRVQPTPSVTLHEIQVPAFWQPLRVWSFSRAAARAAPRGSFDIVHSFSRTRHQDIYRAGGGSHADYLEHRSGGSGNARFSPRHAALLAMERKIFGDPSQIIQCNSLMVRDEIAARYGVADERLAVVWNGVDLERFQPRRERDRAEIRSELESAEEPVWLFAGSGFERKGLDTVLAALAADPAGHARLWIAGRDDTAPWEKRVREMGLASKVRFLGARDDMERVYAGADVFLLPTRYDAFANVCLEAAAAGLPVITSGTNGAAHVFRNAGFVVEDPEDVAGLVKALAELKTRESRLQWGGRCRRVAEGHSWHSHVNALRGLYLRITSV